MITRTITVRCDQPDCGEAIYLASDDIQPFRTLIELGWTLVDAEEGVLTYCPRATK